MTRLQLILQIVASDEEDIAIDRDLGVEFRLHAGPRDEFSAGVHLFGGRLGRGLGRSRLAEVVEFGLFGVGLLLGQECIELPLHGLELAVELVDLLLKFRG